MPVGYCALLDVFRRTAILSLREIRGHMKIKLKDYERIYKTVNTVLLNEDADPTVACTFFSFYGAYLLKEHYKIDAHPVAGLCMYHLGGDNNVLSFAKLVDEQFVSDVDAFHCWVIGDGWLFDFMAPTFPDLENFKNFNIQPKMMQKPISAMAASPYELHNEGDFYFESNSKVLNDRLRYLSSSLAYSDLAELCKEWYKKPPQKMQKAIQIGDGKGKLNSVSLTGKSVVGVW